MSNWSWGTLVTAGLASSHRILKGFAIAVAGAALLNSGCAICTSDLFLTPGKRTFNALKNRTGVPRAADFDRTATLEALLAPGDDRHRWDQTRAAAVEGYVVRVHDAGMESANCFSPSRRDAHIEIARHLEAPPGERLIVEVTPRMRAWAKQQGMDWSTGALARALTGRRVRVEGWLFFDAEHGGEAENTSPGRRGNWRRTAWEIHPVTAIAVAEPK